jgi:multidrug efflux system membrane fusion protein
MRPTLLLALAALAAGCSKHQPPAGAGRPAGAPGPVNVATAVSKDMPVDLADIGRVESINTVGIKAQVGGELIGVHFREGDEVKRGDLLFTIQPRLYQVQLAQAEANVARDRAAAENARRDANRGRELRKDAISKEELDRLLSTAEAAEATVKADEALVEIARVRLGYTTIESPIDGRTGAIQVKVGNLIKDNADTPMVTINQMAPIYVSFAPPEHHLPELRKGLEAGGLPVTAFDPKSKQPLAQGTLTFIDNTVDPATATVRLKATFPNDDRKLWPGAFVDVAVRLRVDPGVVVVPSPAITIGQQGPQVFVVKPDNTVELRQVTPGRQIGQETIIESGLAAGDVVATNGQSRLVPGAAVVVKPASPEPPAAPGRVADGR